MQPSDWLNLSQICVLQDACSRVGEGSLIHAL